jgi:iron complex transport system ATP-binding protein
MGRPEDILLSGKIQDLFPGEKYRFELERGKVELLQDSDNLSIEGPAAGVYWVKKALQKAGVRELPEPIVIEPDFRLTYRKKIVASIDALLQAIQAEKN